MQLRFRYPSHTSYFIATIEAVAKSMNVDVHIGYDYPYIHLEFADNEEFLKALEEHLPNSLFFEKVETSEKFVSKKPIVVPNNVGLCRRCIEEMLDPNSRRYYYPFTMCRACGSHAALLEHYPFERKNTLVAVFQPCQSCQEELRTNPWRRDFPLISCMECNIPVRIYNRGGSRILYANEKEEYKALFSFAAGVLREGKSVRIKTLRGDFRFYLTPNEESKAMLIRPGSEFLMLTSEKRALFSIERPLLHLTHSSGKIYEACGVWDGFTILLANELGERDAIYFDENEEADFVIDYDLLITPYRAPRLFINKHKRCFYPGSQSLFPKAVTSRKTAIYDHWANVDGIVDMVGKFEEIAATEVIVFQDEEIEHPRVMQKDFVATLLRGVLRQNVHTGSAVGVYFGDEPAFYFFKEKRATKIFSFGQIRFEETRKVVARFKERYPDRFEAFMRQKGFLDKAAVLMDLDLARFNKLALEFGGKGGVSVDCQIFEEGFDYSSFYASMMSFILADTSPKLLAYSVYESLGEFMSQQAVEVLRKTKAEAIALAGRHCTNSAFMSRFVRNYPNVLLPIEYPVDDEGVFAGV